MTNAMLCFIYKSLRKPDTYLFLVQRDGFDVVDTDLLHTLGKLEFVMDLELIPGRQLARVAADDVIGALQRRGFHLQVPPASDGGMLQAR